MMKRIAAALTVGAALTVTAPAAADPSITHAASATNMYADALLREATTVGIGYWRARGFGPNAATVEVYDEAGSPPAVARAQVGGDTVYFDRSYRDDIWGVYTDRLWPLHGRRTALKDLCQVATHETGHTVGWGLRALWPLDAQGHASIGIMRSDHNARIPACDRWAVLKLPRRR